MWQWLQRIQAQIYNQASKNKSDICCKMRCTLDFFVAPDLRWRGKKNVRFMGRIDYIWAQPGAASRLQASVASFFMSPFHLITLQTSKELNEYTKQLQ